MTQSVRNCFFFLPKKSVPPAVPAEPIPQPPPATDARALLSRILSPLVTAIARVYAPNRFVEAIPIESIFPHEHPLADRSASEEQRPADSNPISRQPHSRGRP